MSVHHREDRDGWVVRWQEGGRQRSRQFETEREAQAFDRRLKTSFARAYMIENAEARDALETAAVIVLDHAYADIGQRAISDELDHLADHAGTGELRQAAERVLRPRERPMAEWEPQSTVNLPPLYAAKYRERGFLVDWATTLAVVGWKLAQPERHALTSVAEELAAYSIVREARAILEIHDVAEDDPAYEAIAELLETAFQDNDFLYLYDAKMPPPHVQAQMGMSAMDFGSWFEPINGGAIHPFIADSTEGGAE